MPRHKHGHPHLLPVHAEHGGAHLDHERPRHGRARRLTTVLVIAVAVLACVGLALALDPLGSKDAAGHRPAPPAATAQAGTAGTAASGPLVRCRESWRAINRVLAAAERPMRQWETHIEAMNQLVAGKITLAQANEFWARTRAGAHRRYDAFAERDRSLRRGQDRCTIPASASSATPALASCARAVAAAAGTLSAARTTLARWSHHIRDMDRLRDGTLDPAMAQQMWLASWRQGEAEVRVYRDRAHRSSTMSCGG